MTMKEFLAKWGTSDASLLLERVALQYEVGSKASSKLRELSVDLEQLLKAASTPKPNVEVRENYTDVHESYLHNLEAEAMRDAEREANFQIACRDAHERYMDELNNDCYAPSPVDGEPESKMGGDRS